VVRGRFRSTFYIEQSSDAIQRALHIQSGAYLVSRKGGESERRDFRENRAPASVASVPRAS
jgi:hypothetical protein